VHRSVLSLVLTVGAIAACARRAPVDARASDPPCRPSIPVHVVGRDGRPRASVHVWTTSSGRLDETRSTIVETDANGDALVCDAREPQLRYVVQARREKARAAATAWPAGIGGAYDGPPPTSDWLVVGAVVADGARRRCGSTIARRGR
jgi:hypothetical protein